MEDLARQVEPVRFLLPPLRERRQLAWGLGIAFAVFELLFFAFIGPSRVQRQFEMHPIASAIEQAAFVGLILFPFWIVYSLHARATLELSSQTLRLIPSGVDRSLIGAQPEELALPEGSTELLVSQMIVPGKLETYRIIVRSLDGRESGIGGRDIYTRISLRPADVGTLLTALSTATGLPVRAAIRRQTANGIVEETSWQPTPARNRGTVAIGFFAAGLPFAGGILMGWLSPNPAIAAGVGLALWLCLMLALFAFARAGHQKFPLLSSLTTLVTFSATYAACFVVTSYLVGPR